MVSRLEKLTAELEYEIQLEAKRNGDYDPEAFNTAAENLRVVRHDERQTPTAGAVTPAPIGAQVTNPNDGKSL